MVSGTERSDLSNWFQKRARQHTLLMHGQAIPPSPPPPPPPPAPPTPPQLFDLWRRRRRRKKKRRNQRKRTEKKEEKDQRLHSDRAPPSLCAPFWGAEDTQRPRVHVSSGGVPAEMNRSVGGPSLNIPLTWSLIVPPLCRGIRGKLFSASPAPEPESAHPSGSPSEAQDEMTDKKQKKKRSSTRRCFRCFNGSSTRHHHNVIVS